ncbi:dirigent protein 10-like [Andrographis paniculata]|uniref:dirigent protein 10-like n=1 Tax=Andrographis paniculata TaxID=175694 RepID=UPI0021E7B104|nr:dirigent protein 10-like [Andrographis paniculata]
MELQRIRALSILLVLATIVSSAASARLLDQTDILPGGSAIPGGGTSATAPAVVPAAAAATAAAPDEINPATATAPAVVAAPAAATNTAPDENDPATAPAVVPGAPGATATGPAAGAAIGAAAGGNPAIPAGGVGGGGGGDHPLTFFMHDILGGSRPSAIAVTGIVSNPAGNGQVPFAKLQGAVLNVNSGVPTNNANGGIIDNNNIPFLTGLGGFPANVGRTNNNGNNIIGGVPGFPVLNADQFPSGTTLQKLMFGTMFVFDDEVTEGHDLGSGLVGRAQGFYIASSEDGNSQTMAFTVMFKSGAYADSLSFFGIHRTAVAESHLAVMGGTGKFVNAKGFAMVKTLPVGINQHVTDGTETILEIVVYLAY